MKTWFLGCPHFDHEGILAMMGRPFLSVEDMNDYIITRINERAQALDRIYWLGDVSWTNTQFLSRIKCRNNHLIFGNHDKASFAKGFKSAQDVLEISVDGKKFFLSHYPHAYWPSSHYGSIHLYSHVHGERESTLDMIFPDRRSLDVGIDNLKRLLGDYRPIEAAEVYNYIGSGHDDLNFYRELQIVRSHRLWQEAMCQEACVKYAKALASGIRRVVCDDFPIANVCRITGLTPLGIKFLLEDYP